ncbi:MAG: DUF3883 domain-containing protein, partial [Planctomycetaceae bacterium]|nr:DUF3883 domain-containing protein [Planctomycetaceae bacterium]
LGKSVRLFAVGCNTRNSYSPILNEEQINSLECSDITKEYQESGTLFKLGIEAHRIALAYEYDPYFALSLARIDPLPHQLEAVYDYFLKLPRVRFLLADDPGSGKTIMAGLLLKELKVRGIVKRTLIITPANLSFQWQREMQDKFRENFELMRGDVLRSNYGSNPWQDKNQVITSVSWVSRIEDAKDSLLRSHWDLIIVDEAHKMSARSNDKKTLAYKLGEQLSQRTDHYLLMTATPHKGDPEAFCLFLELLDRDVYANVKSLEEAMQKQSAPFYLRRTKEALVTFPNPETGKPKRLFTRRNVKTVEFKINEAETELYDVLTEYVENQSVKAIQESSPASRTIGFTMAMLQRRFASSVYAVRRTLERMADNRKKILADPEKYRQNKIDDKLPDDFDDLSEDEQSDIVAKLEETVASVDPVILRDEIAELERIIVKAKIAEQQGIETKLEKLKQLIKVEKVFGDPKMKLLVFTEHKDTLDYLAGDGKDGRPLGKLREWGLNVTQIHGGMKIGDRETRGTRIYAEREFREDAQILVATEAAGEGINLQFCWLMINYDIPWNPVRLEQRMGRIHRYGQEKECLIHNFVSVNTREGRVLQKLFERIEQIENDIDPEHTGKVFNVLGDIFPSNHIEKMVREMYAKNQTEEGLQERILDEVDMERFKRITNSTLEGLAKRELNLSAIFGRYAEAKERRLVPEVIESFFKDAAEERGIAVKIVKPNTYRIDKLPQQLITIGEQLEKKNGKLGSAYKQIVFNRQLLKKDDARSEWVTPGHPLFEAIRQDVENESLFTLSQGTILYDLDTEKPYHLNAFISSINDGLGNTLHQRLLIVKTDDAGEMSIKEPTLILDLIPAEKQIAQSQLPQLPQLPISQNGDGSIEKRVSDYLSQTTLVEVSKERQRQCDVISKHLKMSLDELIDRENRKISELSEAQEDPMYAANMAESERRLDELFRRQKTRTQDLKRERQCMLGDIKMIAKAWVLPHPQRNEPEIKKMIKDNNIEKIAIDEVTEYEKKRGWDVKSVEAENKGFDLISKNPNAEEYRFIEVKGRAEDGDILLTKNEFQTAERLKNDYYLYIVKHCSSTPKITVIQNPIANKNWKPFVKVEHYIMEEKNEN